MKVYMNLNVVDESLFIYLFVCVVYVYLPKAKFYNVSELQNLN